MEPVRDYELRAFFAHVIGVLERLGIPYMVVGGFAAIFYGEPRLTIDVDILVVMRPEQIPSFVAAFPIEITRWGLPPLGDRGKRVRHEVPRFPLPHSWRSAQTSLAPLTNKNACAIIRLL